MDGGVLTYDAVPESSLAHTRTVAYSPISLSLMVLYEVGAKKTLVAGPVYAGGQAFAARARFDRDSKAAAQVAGIVQTAAGAPVEGAKVTLVRREFSVVQSSLTTGADGTYAFSVDSDPADYIAVASAPGGKTGASAANLLPTG